MRSDEDYSRGVEMLPRVLLAIKSATVRKRILSIFEDMDAMVRSIRTSRDFLKQLSKENADFVMISHDQLANTFDDTLSLIKSLPENPQTIVLTPTEDSDMRGRLLAAGCDAVLYNDIDPVIFSDIFKALLEKRREKTKLILTEQYSFTKPRISDFVSNSPSMQTFMEVVSRIVNSNTSLLILGETGVGKERLARAIHTESPRANGPFIPVNCAALPEALLESELFGHMEGAFTGATRTRRGSFELSHSGTVFLDEIGEMPLHLQTKLLRVLQDREVRPVGSEKPIPIDIRIMAATNKELEKEVDNRQFRPDLYYRLSVVTLTLPPLRERVEDIPSLVENYIGYYNENLSRDISGITPEAMDALAHYPWPGNVRELMNVIERAVLLCRGLQLSLEDLPVGINASSVHSETGLPPASARPINEILPPKVMTDRKLKEIRKEAVERAEISYLKVLLSETRGRIGETARKAGIQPRSLFEKMRQYGLRKEDYRKKDF
jgi:DNA-binding NtrC family response regulator